MPNGVQEQVEEEEASGGESQEEWQSDTEGDEDDDDSSGEEGKRRRDYLLDCAQWSKYREIFREMSKINRLILLKDQPLRSAATYPITCVW